MSAPLKTTDLKALMRNRFCAPEWSIFFEVANSTGAGAGGFADAMAFNLWPSRGLELWGFEIKVSRGDWLRERKDPAKAEQFVAYCDRWYLVTVPDVIKPGELPQTWGHFEIKGSKFFELVKAPKLTPQAWPREFLACLLRRSSELGQDEINAIVRPQVAAQVKAAMEQQERLRNSEKSAERGLAERVEEIEKATGINLKGWQPTEEIALAIKAVLDSRALCKYHGIGRLRDELMKAAQMAADLDKALSEPEHHERRAA